MSMGGTPHRSLVKTPCAISQDDRNDHDGNIPTVGIFCTPLVLAKPSPVHFGDIYINESASGAS